MTQIKLIGRNLQASSIRYGLILLLSAVLFAIMAVSWIAVRSSLRGIAAIRQSYAGTAVVTCYEVDAAGASIGKTGDMTPEDWARLEENPYVAQVEVTGCFFCTNQDQSTLTCNGGSFIRGWRFFLIGYNDEADTPFRDLDPAAVLEGRIYESDTECVVSDLTAEQYGLKIGDVIEFTYIQAGTQESYTLVGIVDHNVLESRFCDPELFQNVFYTTMAGAEPFSKARGEERVLITSQLDPEAPPIYTGYNGLVKLKSYKYFSAFSQEVREMKKVENGRDYRFTATYARSGIEEMREPLLAMSQRFSRLGMLALLLFVGVSFTTAVVGLRARRQQFGTLRAMGMPRRQIALEYGAEQAVVYLGGVLLGCALAALAMALRPEALPALDAAALGSMAEAAAGSLVLLALLVAVALIGVLRFRPMKLLRS